MKSGDLAGGLSLVEIRIQSKSSHLSLLRAVSHNAAMPEAENLIKDLQALAELISLPYFVFSLSVT